MSTKHLATLHCPPTTPQVQKQLAAALRDKEREREALHAQMSGDFAAAEMAYQRQLAEQLEAEREKRVASLQRNAARRMGQVGEPCMWTCMDMHYALCTRSWHTQCTLRLVLVGRGWVGQ